MSSTAIGVRQILDKNNEGVQHIINGRFALAKKAFRFILFYLQESNESNEQQRDLENQKNLEDKNTLLIIETHRIPHAPNHFLTSDIHYIYRDALLVFINPKSVSKQDFDEQNSASLTALVTFNLSLLYHHRADQDKSKSNKAKLLGFYRTAWEALRIDSWMTSQRQTYHDTVALGILNNMGAIFHEIAKYQKARYCFNALKIIFLSNTSDGVLTLTPEARDGMMMNVFFLEEKFENLKTLKGANGAKIQNSISTFATNKSQPNQTSPTSIKLVDFDVSGTKRMTSFPLANLDLM
mmetsp:Transcript_7207/g.10538  ORF Transcript_7207/g.10538 Transcript_7207/m.10538 type:complete len:295 (-) Transcript_7207:201-1085(-)|eukprot:CAMPEP_0194219750 /NCGR_PEP_ID=MMETSP0156-20130528/26766_1 /TAXON_ID=33649 /ORGANISM="Thalassionema nitzschioides, Strain L26-B" /LENGTH=294 /DNA_ID=CAMNT_0038949539 /DNA_START=229 /DNA_END=1113 /DNA_ORIENTATION=-